jgi:hypothetical protein
LKRRQLQSLVISLSDFGAAHANPHIEFARPDVDLVASGRVLVRHVV